MSHFAPDPAVFDAIVDELKRLGDEAAPVIQDMLDAGAEEVRKAWTDAAQRHGFIDTGEMIRSIGPGGPDKGGPFREIYPQGKDPKTGVRNAEKAYLLHYGTSRIKASYWVDEAEDQAQQPMNDAMQAVWNNYIASR